MAINKQKLFLLIIGLLFCILGCARDRAQVLMPDHISPPMEVHETVDVEVSFEQNILPILTSRCALAGCHVADGPHGLDFRTYESFTAGGEHGSVLIPGNAEGSEVVEQIVSGNMPPKGPPLSAAEIQVFVDWINQQEAHDDIVPHEDDHEEVDMDDDHDMDADHDDNMAAHDDMDDDLDDDPDDDADNGHDDNNDNDDDDHDDDN